MDIHIDVMPAKFGKIINKFEFTIPLDYCHDIQLDLFAEKIKGKVFFSEHLSSANFAQASNRLESGKTYDVYIFEICKKVSSEECLKFLKDQPNNIFVGGQGLTLIQEKKPGEFPVGKYTVSFDEKESLWRDDFGKHRVPVMGLFSGSDDRPFDVGVFDGGWNEVFCLLCVCEK